VRERGRAGPAVALVVALAVGVAGCGSGATGEPELTVYLSAPLSGPRAADGRDIADGAKLALADAGQEAAGTAVRLVVLDDANEEGWQASLSGANARRASEDSSAIAYLGELDSGATRTSLPITNEAGLLQVSAGSGAEDLTRDAIGSDDVPTLVQPSGSRTFGRVIPSDREQGQAAAGWMADEGISNITVSGGDDAFGRSLVAGIESSGTGISAVGPDQHPDAVYLAGAQLGIGAVHPRRVPVYGSDAQLEPFDPVRGTYQQLPPETSVTSAALDPTQLPSQADDFLAEFGERYRQPGRYAAYGYEAMAVVLDSIVRAGAPTARSDVVDAFFATADRESILGEYSIDSVGNTSLSRLGAYERNGGRFKPLPEPLGS
jgi:branched-chain amino acid transport system substrate-binding protein